MKKVTDIVAEIAAASREQSSGIEQVNKAVMQMDETTQQNAALVEEAAAASQAIVEQAQTLSEVVARYNVGHVEVRTANKSQTRRRASLEGASVDQARRSGEGPRLPRLLPRRRAPPAAPSGTSSRN